MDSLIELTVCALARHLDNHWYPKQLVVLLRVGLVAVADLTLSTVVCGEGTHKGRCKYNNYDR